ncbi:MAG: hypothetical protein JWQ71_2133 [Pedosphaera sp.]|nr:hypothetical protein [Pedosphaera sp.]
MNIICKSGVPEHPSTKKFDTRIGFTLIELLVVIAIIAILASLLLPALSKAKAKGLQIACLNNTHELQIAWTLFIDDNDNNLPENKSQGSGMLTANSPTNSWITGNAQASGDPTNITSGSLYVYTADVKVYHCPADRSYVYNSATPKIRSFSMNGYLNGIRSDGVTKFTALAPGTSGIFVFLDEHESSIDDGYYLINRAPDTVWPNLPSDRHSQGANLSFADGHSERWKWRAPKQFTTWFQSTSGSQDLQDLRRLQAALPNAP